MAIENAKTVVEALSTLPGVYRFQDAKERVLYVGKANNLKKRVASYFYQKKQSPRIATMLQAAFFVDTIITASEGEALLLENNLIKSLKPKYNILFRDDKTYPYLKLTKHAYPRLMFYRGNAGADADYFGPFPDSNAVRETINILQRVFHLRSCTDSTLVSRSRPCLLHSIGRCSAPCTNQITPENYRADAAQVRQFLNGGSIETERDMQQRMAAAAAEENFEQAAVLRDRLRALAVVRSRHFADNIDGGECNEADYIGIHQSGSAACVNIVVVRGGRRVGEKRLFSDNDGGDVLLVASALLNQYYHSQIPEKIFIQPLPADWQDFAAHLQQHIVTRPRTEDIRRMKTAASNARLALINRANIQNNRRRRLEKLARRLGLANPPQRIECFDISHSMGEETVASRVVFSNGAADKRAYRLFRIRQTASGDDYAAITEAVFRCYRRVFAEKGALPDVLFIDGGVGQVSAALAAFEKLSAAPPALFGIAKGAARRQGEETIIAADGEMMQLAATDGALHLIQEVRDEAHRFAVTAHRRRRDKKRSRSSALDGIEGVGEVKRRLLIEYFGGLPALKAASVSELLKVNSIGPELAVRIYRALH